MTVTTSYSIVTISGPTAIPAYTAGQTTSQPAITDLAGGGYAVVAVDAQGYSDLSIYNAANQLVATNTDFRAADPAITQLTNGNILVAGTIDGTIEYRVFSPAGVLISDQTPNRSTGLSRVALAALSNGSFAAAYQATQGSYTGISLYIGSQLYAVDFGNVSDENASVTQLSDGGIVVAWDRVISTGTQIYYKVYNSDGSVRVATTAVSDGGTAGFQPSVAADPDGGFTIDYTSNRWSTDGTTDVTAATFNAQDQFVRYTRLSLNGDSEGSATSATLSSGLVATVFADTIISTDHILGASFYDSASGTNIPISLFLTHGGDLTSPSITALGHGEFALAYTDTVWSYNGSVYTVSSQQADTGVYELQRITTGDDTANIITGDADYDDIFAEGGNDIILPGGVADNYVDGGAGYDRIVFANPRAGYSVSETNGAFAVTAADGSVTTILNVEELSFSDVNLFTPPAMRDTNGDGYSDMLLQNTNGGIRNWEMGTGGVLLNSTPTSTTPAASWHVVGTGNFNFAVDNFDDILLQNDNGNLDIWEMFGATVTANVSLGSLSNVWKAVTTGDFNGDGNADILLQNSTTGQIDIWTMNGTAVAAKAAVGGAIGTTWHAIATGDFNGDGKSDIVLQNANGQIDIWLMNGATASTTALSGTTGSGWLVRGAGDFNGDGKADLLLQNAAGQVAVWIMNGSTVTAKNVVGTVATSFLVTGTGDFNGDGKSDIVFQNSNGAVAEWLMNGATVTSKLNLGNPGAAWHMVAGTGG